VSVAFSGADAGRSPGAARSSAAAAAVASHWPEYLFESLGLGLFMVSACGFGALLEYPASPVHLAIPDATTRRVIMGALMGLTAVGLIYAPWGKRSGAHMNPSVTLAFTRLGRVAPVDAVFYIAAQIAGGVAGVFLMKAVLGAALADPHVRYVATVPGPQGAGAAFAAELAISFVLMSVVLAFSSTPRLSRFTGVAAGTLVALWIAIEAPISGMSMNPARTLGSALAAGEWNAWWIYWLAPPLAMIAAAEAHRRLASSAPRSGAHACAKLHHAAGVPCIFCDWRAARAASPPASPPPAPAARAASPPAFPAAASSAPGSTPTAPRAREPFADGGH
jgi:aquaporin Z